MTDLIDDSLKNLPPKVDENTTPRWVTERYEGMEQDISDWYQSFFFWRKWNGREDTLNQVILIARANAEAKLTGLMQTGYLRGASDRSAMLQIHQANKSGWFRMINEMEDVYELYELALEEDNAKEQVPGRKYDHEFILKTMLPAMEKLIPVEQIICSVQNKSKLEESVSTMRELLKQETPASEKMVMEVLEEIADPNITVATFRQNNKVRMGKSTNVVAPIPGGIYLIPGCELIVIESDRAHTKAIQIALRGIVEDLSIKDATVLIKDLSQRLLPKSGGYGSVESTIDVPNIPGVKI
jgi:uncharacterized protein YihD (DUF1040 family)